MGVEGEQGLMALALESLQGWSLRSVAGGNAFLFSPLCSNLYQIISL